jgi:hypothetical protein
VGPSAIVVEHRKELSYLLCQAAEIEHLAMCQYLYAAFSLRTTPGPGLAVEQVDAVERWRSEISKVAAEEMLHWALVNNLLNAIGSAPYVSRPDLPHEARGYPPDVQFALLPFGEQALNHFIYFERPEDAADEDAPEFVADGPMPLPMAADELQPRGQDFETQGQLYRSLEEGLVHLSDKLGEDGLFIGAPTSQAGPDSFGWPELVPVTGLESALLALKKIVEQGEGARGDTAGSHYSRFRRVLAEYREVLAADPGFVPAHPVTAAEVRTPDGSVQAGPKITDPTTAAVSDLFNVSYDLLLQMLCRFFAFGHETKEQQAALTNAAVYLMFDVLRPLGVLLASLPVGGYLGDATAGANFQLAYKSNFLLPHRRVAFIRFSERLEEAARFADGIEGDATMRRALDHVATALRSSLVALSAHIEAV